MEQELLDLVARIGSDDNPPTDQELADALSALTEAAIAVLEGDEPDTDAGAAIVEARDQVAGEITARAEATEATRARAAELLARVRAAEASTEESDEVTGGRDADHEQQRADPDREPQPVDPRTNRARVVAGAAPTRHGGGGGVGEEDEEADDGLQERAADGEAAEDLGTEVADEGGVGEQKERFGDEGTECRDGEPQNVTIERFDTTNRRTSLGEGFRDARCASSPQHSRQVLQMQETERNVAAVVPETQEPAPSTAAFSTRGRELRLEA